MLAFKERQRFVSGSQMLHVQDTSLTESSFQETQRFLCLCIRL